MIVTPRQVARAPTKRSSDLCSLFLGASESLSVSGYVRLIDSPEVAAVVGKVADIISSATIYLMENTDRGDRRIKDGLSRFMDIAPWALGTRKMLISWIVTMMLTSGAAYCLPSTSSGYLQSIDPMPGASPISTDNGRSYSVSWNGRMVPHEDLLAFIYRPDVREPWRGAGVRVQLRDVLKNLKQAAATTNAFMSDKWKPPVIVKVDALSEEFSSPEGRQKLADQYISTQRVGEPWILPSELMDVVTVKPLTLEDLAIHKSVELDRRSVASALGVPPYLVGVGAFNKEEYNNFIRTMVVPLADAIAQELTRKLLISPGMYFKFSSRKLYSYSIQELANVGKDLSDRGIMSGNEVRDWVDLGPRDGLDELVRLENFIPNSKSGEQKKLKEDE